MTDIDHMQRVLELAAQTSALASPNPRVAAVLVQGEETVGRGVHYYERQTHAEILALRDAGERARGATLYINLEPCCHTGRTPPCVEALIAAGVARVVAAMPDPNPLVQGRGLERLRAAGIAVEVGCLQRSAQQLNESFTKWIRRRRPFVTLKAGMTLDGKISTPPSRQDDGTRTHEWITSPQARWHVQQLRHEQDAILVGVGTVMVDNPLLTDRTALPRRRPLLRVVLDSGLRLPLDSRLVQTAQGDVVVFCTFAETRKQAALERSGVRVFQVAAQGGRPNLDRVLQQLAELDITSLIVEGGSLVNWAMLNEGCVDKVVLFFAPKILGGVESVPLAGGEGYRRLSEAATLREFTLQRYGPDFAVEGYLTDVYA